METIFSYYRSKIRTPLFWQFSPFQVPTYLVCRFKRKLPNNTIAISNQLAETGHSLSKIVESGLEQFSRGCESTKIRLSQ